MIPRVSEVCLRVGAAWVLWVCGWVGGWVVGGVKSSEQAERRGRHRAGSRQTAALETLKDSLQSTRDEARAVSSEPAV